MRSYQLTSGNSPGFRATPCKNVSLRSVGSILRNSISVRANRTSSACSSTRDQSNQEILLEQHKARKARVEQIAALEQVTLPVLSVKKVKNKEPLSDADGSDSSASSDNEIGDGTRSKKKFKAKEKKIFDFRSLSKRDRKVVSPEDMKAKKTEFKRSIEELRQWIEKTQPNMRLRFFYPLP